MTEPKGIYKLRKSTIDTLRFKKLIQITWSLPNATRQLVDSVGLRLAEYVLETVANLLTRHQID